jgi:hypothetical protein
MYLFCCPFQNLRVIFNTLFGLSVNFWMAITTRFLLGSLNGLLGPIKVKFHCILDYFVLLDPIFFLYTLLAKLPGICK